MAVYVDAPIWKYRRMMMCHLMADTLEELHSMVDSIGVNRKWFQRSPVPHYDICKSKRALAVKHGAIEADRNLIVGVIRAWKSARDATSIRR